MEALRYRMPTGLYAIPHDRLDLRPDSEVDHDILHPKLVTDEKNIWFFWHSGFLNMHPCSQRTVRTWHRRFSKAGWVVRLINRQPFSLLNLENFLDTKSEEIFPRSFIDDTIGGDYPLQHMSDLVRFPLLLKYGGVYADVGLMQIGDIDRVWSEMIDNPASPFEIISYNCGTVNERFLSNYFLMSKRNNALFERAHKLLLKLWAADGGKTSTEGMHSSPLLNGTELLGSDLTYDAEGQTGCIIPLCKARMLLTDYIIQVQVMSLVMGLVDKDDGWDGPDYSAKHIYAMEYIEGSQFINSYTKWNGFRAFELMSSQLPKESETESSAEQKLAQEIVQECLRRSFAFKLAHGMILKMYHETLGSLWRKHMGSDCIPGTYACYLRHGMLFWCPEYLPPRVEFRAIAPFKRGSLLREV
uniref:Putative capsule polysaccharide biosynthesis protein n=1 Tax=Cladonia uncialis subsp. uncialis TaxID=180999 RepID=A0A1Z1C4T2_CLAUC|nr:putative capsule polysaccharide biosynthesis protein [Cladonia uncialis subsp. uncialis]AUW30761.1 putative capsule polysaccharide biosynthesis protein [Cladonia uncialis subsp. uncialis]